MASRRRLAGSPSAPPSPVDLRSVVRTHVARVFLAFVDRPQARQAACCLCQEPGPGHHQDMAGKKVARVRSVVLDGRGFWATSDSLSRADGTRARPGRLGEGPEPTEGRRDGATVVLQACSLVHLSASLSLVAPLVGFQAVHASRFFFSPLPKHLPTQGEATVQLRGCSFLFLRSFASFSFLNSVPLPSFFVPSATVPSAELINPPC